MNISLIAAMANARVIGKENTIPWHLPADLAWFKKNTLGKPIIMGKKTYLSIGKPLPGRMNIIISRTPAENSENVYYCSSIDMALQLVRNVDEIMIIGGTQIYRQLLPIANKLYLTHINTNIAGDAFFPEYGDDWKITYHETHQADEKNPYDYSFEILSKPA